MEEFTTKDILQLRSGGPKMSILRFIGADKSNIQLSTEDEFLKMQGFNEGDVICQWFDDKNKLTSGAFKREMLIKVK